MKLSFTLFLLFLCSVTYSQEKNYYLSAPLEIKEAGWNKVLTMKNGNTLLLHFEIDKPVLVKVFDSTHKEIATSQQTCKILDEYMLREAVFQGIFEINNEAVLFIEQSHLRRHNLIRLSYSGIDGKLLEEKTVGESPSATLTTQYYTIKNKDEDTYCIFFLTDVPQFKECKANISYYNSRHEIIKTLPLDISRKEYDRLDVVSAAAQPNGICITLGLSALVTNPTNGSDGNQGAAEVDNHTLAVYYIPKDSSNPQIKLIDLATETFPFFANYTYNPFGQSINVLMLSYKDIRYKNGLEWRPGALMSHLFLRLDEHNMDLSHSWMSNKMANDYFMQNFNSLHKFDGLPIAMFTNENGLTTIISESFMRYGENESRVRYNYYTHLGNIAVTQVDDNGTELWGAVLPKSQLFKSYQSYLIPQHLLGRSQLGLMFADLPEQVNERQLASVNAYSGKRDFYMVFNDDNKNFNKITKGTDTVYTLQNSNGCYYKLDRKKEITKHHLFGEPAAGEYMATFIEGACFDEKRSQYASLVQCKKENKITYKMGWARLE